MSRRPSLIGYVVRWLWATPDTMPPPRCAAFRCGRQRQMYSDYCKRHMPS